MADGLLIAAELVAGVVVPVSPALVGAGAGVRTAVAVAQTVLGVQAYVRGLAGAPVRRASRPAALCTSGGCL